MLQFPNLKKILSKQWTFRYLWFYFFPVIGLNSYISLNDLVGVGEKQLLLMLNKVCLCVRYCGECLEKQ